MVEPKTPDVLISNDSRSRFVVASPPFDYELVFGLVGPVGTNFDRFQNLLEKALSRFSYVTHSVRLSAVAEQLEHPRSPEVHGSSEYVRMSRLMRIGNSLRFDSKRGDFLVLAAAKDISDSRENNTPKPATAHVLRSLKHPEEVRALRRIYGNGFYLIGVSADEGERCRYLTEDKGCSDSEVRELLARDEHEESPEFVSEGMNYGQRMRDTFQLADVFIRLGDNDQLERFLNLIFGDPFSTPTIDEYAINLAFGASLRSADLSRQVGAVILSEKGDVLGIGANDVPRGGGGLYWPGKDDNRDHKLGEDSNEIRRQGIIEDVLERLRPAKEDRMRWREEGIAKLKSSDLMDITEYGRAVHAEMEAILSCARIGASPRGATLFCTTFPCHNCAKHVVAAGLLRVVYVEPYPKSQAKSLFKDSITFQNGDGDQGRKVLFEPFVGVGPRRFLDLFSMALSSGTKVDRKKTGRAIDWQPAKAMVRVPLLPNSYLDREKAATAELTKILETHK